MADTLFDIGDRLVQAAKDPEKYIWGHGQEALDACCDDVRTAGNVIKSLSGIVIESAYYDAANYTWKIQVDGPDDVLANLLRLASVIP